MIVGDIVEFPLKGGFAYLHLVVNHSAGSDGFSYGWFCRVLAGDFKRRPNKKQLQELIGLPEQFGCFLSDIHRFKVVANLPCSKQTAAFPLCKQPNGRASRGSVWFFWNGTEHRVAYRMPRAAANLPNAEIINSLVLEERIESGWSPARDVPEECIDTTQPEFAFEDYPLASDFEKDPSRYGDISGFLESRGYFEGNYGPDIEVTGLGPFDNIPASRWLEQLDVKCLWEAVGEILTRFQEWPERRTQDCAIALAAATLPLCQAGILKFPVIGGAPTLPTVAGPPRSVLKLAPLIVIDVLLRSGLKRQWQKDPRFASWQQSVDALKTQLFQISIGR